MPDSPYCTHMLCMRAVSKQADYTMPQNDHFKCSKDTLDDDRHTACPRTTAIPCDSNKVSRPHDSLR